MKNDRYIISIAADEDPAIFSKKAKDGATVTMITARTFEEATALYEQAAAGRQEQSRVFPRKTEDHEVL